MANETGDMKITGNFRRLVDFIIADALYDPSNAVLNIANLETKLAAAIDGELRGNLSRLSEWVDNNLMKYQLRLNETPIKTLKNDCSKTVA